MNARTLFWLLVATVALAALGWWTHVPPAARAGTRAVLLTAGWRTAPADGRAVYRLPGADSQSGAQLIPDVATLLRLNPEVRDLEVRGLGVDAAASVILRKLRVTWPDAGAVPAGPEISAVEFPRELQLGQPLVVRGRVAGLAAGAPLTVTLVEPDGRRERVEVVAGVTGEAPFTIVGQPTAAVGRFGWRLSLGERGAGVTVGAVVVAPRRPRVLLAQESATWELGRLHAWLSRTDTRAVLRTRVSADRWRLTGGAGETLDSAALTRAWLAKFDIMIATEAALVALDAAEQAALAGAMREEGLGLLVVGEPSGPRPGIPLLPWRITPMSSDPEAAVRATRIRMASGRGGAESISVWAVTWEERSLLRALARDAQGQVLVAVEPWGQGRLGRSLIHDSWRWLLSGHPADYAALWSELLGALARPEAVQGIWRFAPGAGPITAGQPIEVEWAGEVGRAPSGALCQAEAEVEPAHLRLTALKDRPGQAWTRWWPARAGWHRMADDRGVAADVFVSAAEDWPGLDRARRREVMAALVHRVEEPLEPRGGESAADAWQHRRWLAWGTLVVAAAVLWWRERRGA